MTLYSVSLCQERGGVIGKKLTLVERLDADYNNLEAGMGRYWDLEFLIVSGWHPERESAVVNQCVHCEVENVVKHYEKAVWLLWRDVVGIPARVSFR